MSMIWLILGMGAGVYALRLAGLVMPRIILNWGTRTVPQRPPGGDSAPATPVAPPVWERALGFFPVALLTALVVAGVTGSEGNGPTRLLSAAGAALVAHLTGRMWACILSGMVLYVLLGLI